jgi:hypothetical protein
MKHLLWVLFTAFIAALTVRCVPFKQYNAEVFFEHDMGYFPLDNILFSDLYSLPQAPMWTPGGIPFSGPVTPLALDEVVMPTLRCLGRTDAVGKFGVVVAANAKLSEDKTQEVLPVLAPSQGCLDKGLDSGYFTCHFRDGVRGPESKPIAISTPSMYTLPAAVARIVMRVPNPWAVPEYAKCLGPYTKPLSGLVH